MSKPERGSTDIAGDSRQETVLYHAGDVWITDTRLVIGDRSYWLKDTLLLDVVSSNPKRGLLGALSAVPAVVLLLVVWIQAGYDSTWFGKVLQGVIVFSLAAVLCLVVFSFLVNGRGRTSTLYRIKLNGKKTIYATTDGDYALWLVRQVSRAKEGRGRMEEYYSPLPGIGAGEYVYHSDGVASVTSKRVMLGGESFELGEIKKAYVTESRSEQYARRWNLVLVFMALTSTLTFVRRDSSGFGPQFYLFLPGDIAVLTDLFYLVTLGAMIWSFMGIDPITYKVTLRGKFGGAGWVEVFATLNGPYAKVIAAGINRTVNDHKAGIYAGSAAIRS
jgi:hypothetical protein